MMDLVCAAFVKVERSNKVCCLGSDYGASVLFHKYRRNSTRSAQRDWLMLLNFCFTFLPQKINILCDSTNDKTTV